MCIYCCSAWTSAVVNIKSPLNQHHKLFMVKQSSEFLDILLYKEMYLCVHYYYYVPKGTSWTSDCIWRLFKSAFRDFVKLFCSSFPQACIYGVGTPVSLIICAGKDWASLGLWELLAPVFNCLCEAVIGP